MTSTAQRYARLRHECSASGIRMTPQRDVLLRALSESTGHPTADDLVQRVRRSLPSVSHATVYRHLQELVSAGLIGTLERAGGAVHFEVNPEHHHHFVCRRCGQVWDVYLSDVAYQVNSHRSPLKGFAIERPDLQLRGLCASCR